MEKNCSQKFSSRIFRLLLPYASVMIISVHVSNFMDASNLEAWKMLAERGFAAALALAVQPANAQSDETCIAYMEADAIYREKKQNLEVFCRCPSSVYDVIRGKDSKLFIHARLITMLMSPDGKPLDPACTFECATELYDLETSRKNTYREAYDGPTSDMDSVMKKLIRIDRVRCLKRFEMVLKP